LKLLLAEDLEGLTGALFLKIRKLGRLAPDPDPATLGEGRRLWGLSERLAAQALGCGRARPAVDRARKH
jgi:hypothetical protein